LSSAEVAVLAGGVPGVGDVASYCFDEASGTTAVDSSGNGRDATIVSPPVVAITPQGLAGYWEAPYLFKRNGTYYLAYARGNPRTGGNPATIDYATATNPFGPWTYQGRILDTVTNTTTNHSAIVEFEHQWYVVYHDGMAPGGGEFRRSVCVDKLFFNDDGTISTVAQTLSPSARRPVAAYPLDKGTADATGNGWDATAVNGAARVPGLLGRALRLDGVDQYLSLPAGVLWNMYDFTIVCWVKPDSADGSPHVFDFGTGQNAYLYLTSRSTAGAVRFAITTGGATREQRVDGTAALPAARWTHVAVMKSALAVTLFVDGIQVGQNPNVGIYPARLGNTTNNWFGRSQNPADPFLAGVIDDIQIHQRKLDPSELADLIVVGLIYSLADYVRGLPIRGGIKNSLTVKLNRAADLLTRHQPTAALAGIDDFVGEVNGIRGHQLTDAQADELVSSAGRITTTIHQTS
jgi:hypothetical protein